jgi:hypothetical protein
MRILPLLLFVSALSTPAVAQEKTTLEWVTTNSVTMSVAGRDFPVTYTPDHKLSAASGQVTGTWRIEGETLCSIVTSMPNPQESCVFYPPGKKPGDSFEIESPQGVVTITINKEKPAG